MTKPTIASTIMCLAALPAVKPIAILTLVFLSLQANAEMHSLDPVNAEAGTHLAGHASSIPSSPSEAFRTPSGDLSYKDILNFQRGKNLFDSPVEGWISRLDTAEVERNATRCNACHAGGGRKARRQEGVYEFRDLPISLMQNSSKAASPRQIKQSHSSSERDPTVTIKWVAAKLEIDAEQFDVVFPKVLEGGQIIDSHIVRIPPSLIGLSLIDAIRDSDIGQKSSNQRTILRSSTGNKVGRFGLTAEVQSLRDFVVQALEFELGVSTISLVPESRLDALIYYTGELGVPVRDGIDARSMQGYTIFSRVGCSQCHRPSYGISRIVGNRKYELVIWPFSDFYIYDLGYAGYSGPEYLKTTPLWGVGRVEKDLGFGAYMFDGRARSLFEAILWHGGEAASARADFLSLGEDERAKVLEFLKSL